MQAHSIHTRKCELGESLFSFIVEHVERLPEKSILAIASKVVAFSQREWMERPFTGADVAEASDWSVETPYAFLTLVGGHWCPNAGMDASNANGGTVLWPTNLEAMLKILREQLQEHYGSKDLGLIVTDSRIFPLRQGVTAVSLAHSGFLALRDYRGEPDLDGRPLRMTTVNVADALATTAALLMGEGNEQQPLCLIQEAPVVFTEKPISERLFIDSKDDLFAPLYRSLPNFPLV